MYGNQKERIPDLLESPNSRRDLRNSRLSNDHFRRYENAMTKYERLSPHPRRRLTNNARLEQQYYNFQGHSSSDECLTRNKSKSTSSIDTQSVNNILDEYEDLDYRRSSDLSDIDVGKVEVTNFDEMMDLQKRQATEKLNSRVSKSQNQETPRDHHYTTSPTKVNRQTQVQQRSRDWQKNSKRRFFSPSEESSRSDRKSSSLLTQNPEVRASIRSSKTQPEILLRKGEVQKRVDEWLSQTRSQNCIGFNKESRGLTRSNSSAEQKSHRRLRQQELRSRRCQLNGSSSYDDLTHDDLKFERKRTADNTQVSIGVNTSRGTYKQYLALKNKARLQKQQQENSNTENTNQESTNVVLRSREASPATRRMHFQARGDAMNLSFRSSSSKRQDFSEQEQRQNPTSNESVPQISIRSKNARARHHMENRIYSLIKARNEMSATSETSPTAAAVSRRSSFKCESSRNSSKSTSTNSSPSKHSKESGVVAETRLSQEQMTGVLSLMRSSEQDSNSKTVESNPPTEFGSDLSQEIYGSVSARVRAFQGSSEHRMPKSKNLQGSNVLIETRNKSPMSRSRKDSFHQKEGDRNQSTFKPNVPSLNQHNEQGFKKREREIDSTTRYVEKIYETTLQPEVIHADNLESIFRPGRTNFVYGERTSKDLSSSSSNSVIFKRENDSAKRKTINMHTTEAESKPAESSLSQCLTLLQRSPSFRLKRSRPLHKEEEICSKTSSNEKIMATDPPKRINSFITFQSSSTMSTSQTNATEKPLETNIDEPSVARQRLHSDSYEARSTLKLNSPKMVDDIIENDKNKREDISLKGDSSGVRQGIISSNEQPKNESTSHSANNVGVPEQTHSATREKTEDGAVINEVLVKNLQFKQDVPSTKPPAPSPRTCLEPPRKQDSAPIVELSPLRNKPLNYNSVLRDDYANLHSRAQQQQQQQQHESGKIYVTKEEMERKKLMDLLRKGEFELVKMILFWNIAGLGKIGEEGWNYIRGFDVIGISETWIEEKYKDKIKDKLKELDIWIEHAERTNRKGRAKGGILWGAKIGEDTKVEKFIKINKEWQAAIIKIKDKRWIIGKVYMRDKREENYRELEKIREEEKGERMMIEGDFNARTGENGGKVEQDGKIERKSKDKCINREGEELIKWARENGLHILNGKEGKDNEGYTYTGAAGFSIIDYVLINEEGEKEIKRMSIGNRIESDHQALDVELEERSEKEDIENDKIVTDWSEEGERRFKENLEGEKESKTWTELKERIKNPLSEKRIKRRKMQHREEWWDEEFWWKKTEVEKKLQEAKKAETKKDT